VFTEKFEKYKMSHVQKKITQNSPPEEVIAMFKTHFTDKYMDKLIITLVINSVLHIVKTYCNNKSIQTLMLAIDGVPSKGKMVEQKQRRYMGAIIELYKKKILHEYKDYLLGLEDFVYLATHDDIKWSRNKITPGTAFMHKMVNYLRSNKIQTKLKINRPNMQIVISDMYEVGEGEKKIVNYVNEYLKNTNESIIIYSPDADVILLCMLLPVKKLYMLRYNDQVSRKVGSSIYDLIDIRMLKSNIAFYINNNPNFSKEKFDIDRINYDIVCISTLFGNDFVPKVETLNVKKGFQSIMDAYLKTLLNLKDKGYYLVKNKNGDGEYHLNFTFLKGIIRYLLPEEDDFIKHNNLYAQYITIGQIKYVFDYMEINSENLVSTYNQFSQEYGNLKNLIKNNGNFTFFETNDQFMTSLKRAAVINIDGVGVSTSYLSNKEMIKLLKDYYRKSKDFPRLNINLNTWSHSINDYIHKNNIKEKHLNDYRKELYKFDNMLDEYYIKFNAQPLMLTKNKINDYYEKYFDVTLTNNNGDLTKEANQVMHNYLEGILWVFNYYYNDTSYVNKWYYEHERAPLMRHFLMFLDKISLEYFNDVYTNLSKYQVSNLENYFNPVEQLIYVSPMTEDIIKLLPSNYRKYITSDNLDPFLRTYFIDINEIVIRLWNDKISKDVDCRGIIYFNKCGIKSIGRPTSADDKQFLKAIRKVKQNEISEKRSKSVEPEY
jgi:5'-3' exonuclease